MENKKNSSNNSKQEMPLWEWAVILLAVAFIFTLLAQFVFTRNSNFGRAIDFFANFGGASIAALFVVYQARHSHKDVADQIANSEKEQQDQRIYENHMQQALAYNKVRPMLYFLVKTFKTSDSADKQKILPGDKVFVMSRGFKRNENDLENVAQVIDKINANTTENISLFELKLFYGEPIHHVRINFEWGTGYNSRLYIPYLEPNKNNVILSGDMFKTDEAYQHDKLKAVRAQEEKEWNEKKEGTKEDHHQAKNILGNYGKYNSSVPQETVVNKLLSKPIEIEFDTVLQEHVKVTFGTDSTSQTASQTASTDIQSISLSYNLKDQTTKHFMKELISTQQIPEEKDVQVVEYTPENQVKMEYAAYTTVYEVPETETIRK